MEARKKKILMGGAMVAAVAGIGAFLFWPTDANAEPLPLPPPPPDPKQKPDANAGADARQADEAFAVVTTAAATAAIGLIPPPGSATPYVAAATPVVIGAWKNLAPQDKANIWRGQANVSHSFASGSASVLKWATSRFVYELKRQMNSLKASFCANADKVYEKLHDADVGKVGLPKRATWKKLSCDQKVAFVAALGPQGALMLASGALVASWAMDAKAEFKKYGQSAASAVDKIAAGLGGGAQKIGDEVKKGLSSAGNAVSDAAKSIFGAPPTMRGQIAGRPRATQSALQKRMGTMSNLSCSNVLEREG